MIRDIAAARRRFGFSKTKSTGGKIVAYNYRKAEKEWLVWKQEEEQKLRALGADEDMIRQLHTYDWEQFKQERRFYRWHTNANGVDLLNPADAEELAKDVRALLDSIENEQLLEVLSATDTLTLKMLLLRMNGYSCKQIAQKYCLQEMAVINRIARLRKKLKKIF